MKLCLPILIVAVLVAAAAGRDLTEEVNINNGRVQGEIYSTVNTEIPYASFRGIRYGQPPINENRFKSPKPAESWSDVFPATSEATPCPQIDPATGSFIGDEDCLNLNVYTPKTQFADQNKDPLLPVMVWIHGADIMSGYTNKSVYGPDFLIENGVVVVAMNYRVGPLGFLSLNTSEVSGNAGFEDQILALKWVQENIKAFGGNPKNVTIVGYASGADFVDRHTVSLASQDLFHRSIGMNGSASNPQTSFSSVVITRKAFGFNPKPEQHISDFLQYLNTLSANEIVVASSSMAKSTNSFEFQLININSSEEDRERIKNGSYKCKPHLVGYSAKVVPSETEDSNTQNISVSKNDDTYCMGTEKISVYFYIINEVHLPGDQEAYMWNIKVSNIPTDQKHLSSAKRGRVSKMWTNFAKTSVPIPDLSDISNLEFETKWGPYSTSNRRVFVIDNVDWTLMA